MVVLALLMLAAEREPAHAASTYVTSIIVPGDPGLANQMQTISRLVARQGAVDSELTLRRRATADLDQLGQAARAAGYYDAKLSYDIDTTRQPWRVAVKVDLGAPYRLREVRVVGPEGSVPPLAAQLDPAEIGLELGMRARSAPILDAQDKLLRYYTTRGYPLAKVTRREAVIDRADHSMHVTYTVAPGPLAAFGPAEITGLKAVDRRFVLNRLGWKEGDPYDSSKVDSTTQALVASNLFATVKIAPAEKPGPGGRIPILIAVTERPARSIGGGLYYDGTLGFGAKAFWEHRNLFGQGELLHLETTVGPNDNSLLIQFKRADFLTTGLDLRAEGSVAKLITDAYDSKRATIFAGLDRHFDSQTTGGIGVQFMKGQAEDDTGTQYYTLAGLPAYIRRDDTDDLLNPTRGTRLGLTAIPYTSLADESLHYLETKLSASGYQSLDTAKRFVLAGYTNIGSIAGVSLDALPRDLRLYEGGGGSVRGYGYQRAGPLDIFGNPTGGISSFDLGLELRTRITDTIGIATFIEGGTVYDTSLPELGQPLFWGAGAGVRYFSPVGPLRFDIATPINPRPSDGLIQVYISLGQAF